MNRYYLLDNHNGKHVYAKCYCGHRWEEIVSKKMAESCPHCDGTMRINYSFREYQDSKPCNYTTLSTTERGAGGFGSTGQ